MVYEVRNNDGLSSLSCLDTYKVILSKNKLYSGLVWFERCVHPLPPVVSSRQSRAHSLNFVCKLRQMEVVYSTGPAALTFLICSSSQRSAGCLLLKKVRFVALIKHLLQNPKYNTSIYIIYSVFENKWSSEKYMDC